MTVDNATTNEIRRLFKQAWPAWAREPLDK